MRFTVLLLFASLMLCAQSQSGGLSGTVTDSSGAVIPAARVVLSSGGQPQREVRAQADGSYSFTGLAANEYKVTVSYPGFAAFERTLAVGAGTVTPLPVQLVPISGKQEVNVSAEAAAVTVDSEHTASAIVMKAQDLDALPDDPDDLSDMLTVLAGPSQAPGGGALLVDGFSGGQLPPKNTIKEIRLNQNPFSTEYEYLGFGRIEIITKPGTDTLRGNFQLTDSDSLFNSRNPFAANKASYVNRNLNETLSDSFRHKGSWSLNATQNRINSNAIIHALTLDTETLATVPVDESVTTPQRNLAGTARVDYQFSQNHSLTARYSYSRFDRENSGIGAYSLVSRAYSGEGFGHELQLTETAVVNPHMASETRFGYNRNGNQQYGDNSAPAINVDGAFSGGSNPVGAASVGRDHFMVQNVSTWIHGTHTVRFGGDWYYDRVTDVAPANFGGTFTFLGVGNAPALDANNQPLPGTSISITSLEQYRRTLLFEKLGYPYATIQALGGGASQFSIAGGNPAARANESQFEEFAQEDWRIRPNFQLSIGVRSEVQTHLRNPLPVVPRIGLAWSPGSTAAKPGKTVFRVGAGLFYDRFGTGPALTSAHYNGITEQQYLVTNPGFFQTIPSLATLAAQRQAPVTWRMSPDMRPSIDKIQSATMERQLPRKTTLTATFLHIDGSFPFIANINTPLPGTYDPANPASGVRPYGNAAGNILEYQSGGRYNQKLTMIKWDGRITQKISLVANYTLQFSNHDGNWLATPSNPYNRKQDYGRAGYDRRHQFNLTGTVQAPWKLQFNPMLVMATGAPYDLTIGHDLNGDSFGSDRPAFATDLTRPSVVFTRFGAFDTNPMPGQTIVPHNYLMSAGMWNLNARLGRTFGIGRALAPGSSGDKRVKLNVNLDVNNVFNHLSPGGYVGNLSSPLFGQPTGVTLFREASNLRRMQLGMSVSF